MVQSSTVAATESLTQDAPLNLLLLSNSRNEGMPFLAHAEALITEMLTGISDVLLLPYANPPGSRPIATASEFFAHLGLNPTIAEDSPAAADQVRSAGSFFILGGNTFRLLAHLYDNKLLEALRDAACQGIPLMGASAGSNAACPTISTTNDMPIVGPPSLKALDLLHFQLNPHFVSNEYEQFVNFTGESRTQRLEEYVAETGNAVLGIPEGSGVQVTGRRHRLIGPTPGVAFIPGQEPFEVAPGDVDPAVVEALETRATKNS